MFGVGVVMAKAVPRPTDVPTWAIARGLRRALTGLSDASGSPQQRSVRGPCTRTITDLGHASVLEHVFTWTQSFLRGIGEPGSGRVRSPRKKRQHTHATLRSFVDSDVSPRLRGGPPPATANSAAQTKL
eukprot:363665-Chlamydomonas_euryale.AAC.10